MLLKMKAKELDYAINVTGTENVAKGCRKHGATLVYISTDYVLMVKTSRSRVGS